MTLVVTQLPAPPPRSFELLCDPRTLHHVVLGARTIRRFDPRWPEPGTEVKHSVGIGPLVLRDRTLVREELPARRLVLEAHVRLVGVLHVQFDLSPDDGATRLEIEEHPLRGLVALPALRRAVEVLIGVRNRELARRLRRLVAARERQRAREDGDG